MHLFYNFLECFLWILFHPTWPTSILKIWSLSSKCDREVQFKDFRSLELVNILSLVALWRKVSWRPPSHVWEDLHLLLEFISRASRVLPVLSGHFIKRYLQYLVIRRVRFQLLYRDVFFRVMFGTWRWSLDPMDKLFRSLLDQGLGICIQGQQSRFSIPDWAPQMPQVRDAVTTALTGQRGVCEIM